MPLIKTDTRGFYGTDTSGLLQIACDAWSLALFPDQNRLTGVCLCL